MPRAVRQDVFHLVLIKPTHYDDDGYPLQWRYSTIPSNALACVNGIAEDCRERRILGEDVEIRIHARDESNSEVRPDRLIAMMRRHDAAGLGTERQRGIIEAARARSSAAGDSPASPAATG